VRRVEPIPESNERSGMAYQVVDAKGTPGEGVYETYSAAEEVAIALWLKGYEAYVQEIQEDES
jgi:hypothetical protein